MALFESYERRIDQINAVLNSYGISSIEEAEKITKEFGAVAKASLKLLDKYNRFKFDDIEEHVNLFLEEIAFYEDEELNILKEKIEFEIIQLPEKSREVFKAVVLENLTYKQVAERYHISVNTVKTHYSNALRQLRRNLGKIVAFLLLFS